MGMHFAFNIIIVEGVFKANNGRYPKVVPSAGMSGYAPKVPKVARKWAERCSRDASPGTRSPLMKTNDF